MKLSVADFGAWLFNVTTSVAIIFANKILMGSMGYGFNFAVTLSGLHFLASALLMHGYMAMGITKPSKSGMPWKDRASYTLVSCLSIVSLNVSLLVNSIGVYQLAKLCNIPFVAFVEALAYSRHFSAPVVMSMALVVLGVAVVTVSDVTVNPVGLFFAVASIVAAGSQQLLCRHLQTTLAISSNEMLHYTAWPMSLVLLSCGPNMDWFISQGRWVFDFEYGGPVVTVIVATCTLAVGVNLSQFMCLGRFTAVGYQVLGHAKTVCVLLGGAVLFHEPISLRVGAGMLMAVAGMVGYGYYSHMEAELAKQKSIPEDKSMLLEVQSTGSMRTTASLAGAPSQDRTLFAGNNVPSKSAQRPERPLWGYLSGEGLDQPGEKRSNGGLELWCRHSVDDEKREHGPRTTVGRLYRRKRSVPVDELHVFRGLHPVECMVHEVDLGISASCGQSGSMCDSGTSNTRAFLGKVGHTIGRTQHRHSVGIVGSYSTASAGADQWAKCWR